MKFNHKLLTNSFELVKGTWNVTDVTVVDANDNDKEIYKFRRNYPSINKASWFPFRFQDKDFAFVGMLYNKLEIVNLQTKEITTCEAFNESRQLCPVDIKEISEGTFLLNYACWGGPESPIAIVKFNGSHLSIDFNSFRTEMLFGDLSNVEISDEGSVFLIKVPEEVYYQIPK